MKAEVLVHVPVAMALLSLRGKEVTQRLLWPVWLILGVLVAGWPWPLYCTVSHGSPLPVLHATEDREYAILALFLVTPLDPDLWVLCWDGMVTAITTAIAPEWTWSVGGFVVRYRLFGLVVGLCALLTPAYLLSVVRSRGLAPESRPAWRISRLAASLGAAPCLLFFLAIMHQALTVHIGRVVGGRYLLNALPWFLIAFAGAEERLAPLVPSGRLRRGAAILTVPALVAGSVWFVVQVAEWYSALPWRA